MEKLFLMDGPEKTKVHSTVKKVVDIVGTAPYMFRRGERYSGSDLENKNTRLDYFKVDGGHLDVPPNSYPALASEIPTPRNYTGNRN